MALTAAREKAKRDFRGPENFQLHKEKTTDTKAAAPISVLDVYAKLVCSVNASNTVRELVLTDAVLIPVRNTNCGSGNGGNLGLVYGPANGTGFQMCHSESHNTVIYSIA